MIIKEKQIFVMKRIYSVLNSCENYGQLLIANRYCNRLIKYHMKSVDTKNEIQYKLISTLLKFISFKNFKKKLKEIPHPLTVKKSI
jgi:hypothetical protein